MNPPSFFKYCPVYQDKDLASEYSIKNLINSQAVFSTRKNFNDLFDSKVEFIKPNWQELKAISRTLSSRERANFKNNFNKNNWNESCDRAMEELTKLLDSYHYYCVTDDEKSNLMWSHYASSHTGFCIEWDSEKIDAKKVHYQEEIAKFKIVELIKLRFNIISKQDFEESSIIKSMLTKLEEWCYESEYRFQLSHAMESNIKEKNDKFYLVEYKPEWIKSIILGCRTSDKTKSYIKKNLQFKVKFKQAYEAQSSIRINELK